MDVSSPRLPAPPLWPALILALALPPLVSCLRTPTEFSANCDRLEDMIRAPGAYSSTRPDLVAQRAFEEWLRDCSGKPRPDTANSGRRDQTRDAEDGDGQGPGGGGFENP